jgi:hypothetical protein
MRPKQSRVIRAIFAFAVACSIARGVTIEGEILDAATNRPLPARLSIQGADGTWHFAQSATASGTAVRYDRQRANTNSVERHTTLSAHPFRVELPPGRYTFTISHGKEFLRETRDVAVDANATPPKLSFRLRRWIDMAKAGWYSGDTHVHRAPAELANVMLAEDLNVALPLLDWTTDTHLPVTADPRSTGGQFETKVITIDATHVWHPRNTEFEFFRVNQRSHRLGALFVLNHRARFEQPVFSLPGVIQQARSEGALLSLEKHNWEWTIALAPLLGPAVIELANNHLWQTDYTIKNWAVPAPAWMKLTGSGTDTERDWTLYGFQSYYALLNCGFRLAPTAGSASGVHPVPLGFSRVYVQIDGAFNYDAWMRGLAAGRSFVTTGPMLIASVAGRSPGTIFDTAKTTEDYELRCSIRSEQPLESIELIVNGEIAQTFAPRNRPDAGAFATEITAPFRPRGSSWIAWRCFEKLPAGRIRFAHTAPWHFTDPGQPLRPRRVEADWLVTRVKEEIARSRGVVTADLLADYERALKIYEALAANARN